MWKAKPPLYTHNCLCVYIAPGIFSLYTIFDTNPPFRQIIASLFLHSHLKLSVNLKQLRRNVWRLRKTEYWTDRCKCWRFAHQRQESRERPLASVCSWLLTQHFPWALTFPLVFLLFHLFLISLGHQECIAPILCKLGYTNCAHSFIPSVKFLLGMEDNGYKYE